MQVGAPAGAAPSPACPARSAARRGAGYSRPARAASRTSGPPLPRAAPAPPARPLAAIAARAATPLGPKVGALTRPPPLAAPLLAGHRSRAQGTGRPHPVPVGPHMRAAQRRLAGRPAARPRACPPGPSLRPAAVPGRPAGRPPRLRRASAAPSCCDRRLWQHLGVAEARADALQAELTEQLGAAAEQAGAREAMLRAPR